MKPMKNGKDYRAGEALARYTRNALPETCCLLLLLLGTTCHPRPEPDLVEAVNVSRTVGVTEDPSIAVDASGTVHLVWFDASQGCNGIFYAYKLPGDTWVGSKPIFPGGRFPNLAIDKTDRMHLVWVAARREGFHVCYSSRRLKESWAEPETLRALRNAFNPVVSVDSSLNVHLFWNEYLLPDSSVFYHACETQGGVWQVECVFSGREEHGRMHAATDRSGALHIVFDMDDEVYYIQRRPDGTWTDTLKISHSPNDWDSSIDPSMAIGPDGTLHVVWHDSDRSMRGLAYVERSPTGTWSNVQSPYAQDFTWENVAHAEIGLSLESEPQIIWEHYPPGLTYGVRNGTAWEEPRTLRQHANFAMATTMAIDRQGTMHFAWQGHDTISMENDDIYYIEYRP